MLYINLYLIGPFTVHQATSPFQLSYWEVSQGHVQTGLLAVSARLLARHCRDFPTFLNPGLGPLIWGKLAGKSTKLGKLDQKKKEQDIYILTRFNLKFELNI